MKRTKLLIILILLVLSLVFGLRIFKTKKTKLKIEDLREASPILKLKEEVDLKILDDPLIKSLQRYGPQEIKVDRTGRSNPFTPY